MAFKTEDTYYRSKPLKPKIVNNKTVYKIGLTRHGVGPIVHSSNKSRKQISLFKRYIMYTALSR